MNISRDGPVEYKVEIAHVMEDKSASMKSAYELAMERLNKTSPAVKLSAAQKKQLAELDSLYAAKIAAREIALNGEIAQSSEDFQKEESLREQLANERRKLQAELEEKKDQIRHSVAK